MNESLVPKQETQRKQLVELLDKFRPAIAKLLPSHLTPDRILKLAHVSLSKTPGLIDCDPMSIVKSVIVFSQLGLDFDSPLGTGYLVPFRDNKSGKTLCTPIIGYRGYLELARRSGHVRSVEARAVFEGDEFDFAYGTASFLTHKPKALSFGKDKLICVYAIAHHDRACSFDVMWKGEVENIRIGSRNGEGSVWARHYVEMAKKTVIRRLAKMLPLSPELAASLEVEQQVDSGEVPLINSEFNTVSDLEEKQTATEKVIAQLEGK